MKQIKRILFMGMCVAFLLTGCEKKQAPEDVREQETPTAAPTEMPAETPEPEDNTENPPQNTEPEEIAPDPVKVQEMLELSPAGGKSDISEGIRQAIEGMAEGFSMDVTNISFEQEPQMEVKNLYYMVISDNQQLQYAYDVETELTDGQLTVKILYMPYRTGNYPEGFEGEEAATAEDLLRIAEENLEKESVKIRITNPQADIEEMYQFLRQAGEGFFVCMLNADATEILIRPGMEYSREEALEYMAEIHKLAERVIAERITEGMTEREKAEALYSYITGTVEYDFRYYNDLRNMPPISRTAYGALHDGLAICGGYSLAVRKLFTKAGIPCYTVSGVSNGEDHLWNAACIDGVWLYFDATADRGKKEKFRYFAVTAEELEGHKWDRESTEMLF